MTYSFRAWVDEFGGNADHEHAQRCVLRGRPCRHTRLWDLNRSGTGHNVLRVERRTWPVFLRVLVGRRYRRLLRVGRPR